MHEVLVSRLGGLSLPRKSAVRLTDRPDMTLDVYRGRKTTIQQQQQHDFIHIYIALMQFLCRSKQSDGVNINQQMKRLLLWSFDVCFRKKLFWRSGFIWIFNDLGEGAGADNSNGVNFEHHRKLLLL